MSSRADNAAPRSGRTRLFVLAVVLAVMTLLTAGWPLLNMAVSDNRGVAADSKLTVGTSSRSSGTVTMGPGWSMESAQSDPEDSYSLQRGSVQMSLDYINLINMAQTTDLWSGLRRLVSLEHRGFTLSEPAPITSVDGYEGLLGLLADKSMAGTAAIFPSPSRRYAIEIIVLSPRQEAASVVPAVIRTIRSLQFPQAAS